MLNMKETLQRFAQTVVSEARVNLTREKKDTTKSLSNSLAASVNKYTDSYVVEFLMDYYGIFVDQGVSGIHRKYDTPYSYKSKGGKQGLKGMPPTKAFDKWSIMKGIAPRDKKGRFLPRKSVNFAIARSVFEKGIKPSLFFTKPFKQAFVALEREIGKDYKNEIESIFKKLDNGK
ncbi:MAG: hypothetical protein Unbinned5607contig1000_23 [Prokaryotic dsDNA virus sp.]|nr:MAG: hypothetical protein Unbinned5607contig1000_23 [Prokaryotic dsDNA virus sp.]|tara:strand:+ start:3528 stop:4052 length:525 start_codon:yes stop_codon:yes gene_type:complete